MKLLQLLGFIRDSLSTDENNWGERRRVKQKLTAEGERSEAVVAGTEEGWGHMGMV